MALKITDSALDPGITPPETTATPNARGSVSSPTNINTNVTPPNTGMSSPAVTADQNLQNLIKFLKVPGNTTLGVKEMTKPTEPVSVSTPPPVDNTNLSSTNSSLISSILGTQTSPDKSSLSSFLKSALESDTNARTGLDSLTANVEQKQQAVNKLNTELATLDKEYRDQVDAIKNTTSGITRDQQQGFLNDAQYRYENRRANIAIAYNSAVGDLKATQDAIKTKTDALDNKWNRNIQAYTLMSNAIQNDLTESEKLIVQNNLNEKNKQAELVRTTYGTALTQAVENGAPSYILDAIDTAASKPNATAADIFKAAGSYAVKPTDSKTEQVKLDDGTIQLINSNTGEIIATYGRGADSGATSEQLLLVNDINNILADPEIDNVFGLQNIAQRSIPGTRAFTLASQVNNVIQQAALAQRGKLKGQGAVSDFEGKMLKEAVTALKFNQNPEDAKQALVKLKGAVTTSSGGSAKVRITDKDGNAKDGLANQKMINEAISSGYRVEYQ